MRAPDRRSRLLCPLLLCLLPVLLQWPDWSGWLSQNPIYSFFSGLSPGGRPLLDGAPFVDGNAGVTMQALGRVVVRQWLHGQVPWWNHDAGVGLPLAAGMQPGAFFLPFILLLGLWDGLTWLKVTMQAMAGLATYALLRRLGVGRWAACLGSVLFELNGTFALFSDAPIMPLPFLPLLLLAVERCASRARAGLRGGGGLVALALGFSLVACFPELAYLDGLLAGAWSLLRLAQAGPARARLAAKLCGGALLGLAATLPATWPFVQYLQATGLSVRSAATLGLQAPHWAMLLLPALFGPPFWARHYALWSTFVGGTCDTALLLLALLGAALPRAPERGLRRLLTLWMLAAALKLGNVAPAAGLLNHLPFMRMVQFFRYGQPGLEMAACLLAAFALDRWHAAPLRRPWPALAALLVAGLTAAALLAAGPTLRSFGDRPLERWFLAGSVGWALVLLALLARTLGRPARPRARALLAGLLVLDASLMFSLPMLAGARSRTLDLGGVSALRQALGLQRIYTAGPLGPNYPGFFGLASIDYNSVLVPRDWAGYIRRHLDPLADPAVFNGTTPGAPALPGRPAALARLGVGFIVTPPGQGWRSPPPPAAPLRAVPILPGGSLAATLSGDSGSVPVDAVRLALGFYGRPGAGLVSLRLCQGGRCAAGRADLAGQRDNAPLAIALRPALALRAGQPLALALGRPPGEPPVALWFRGGSPVFALHEAPDAQATTLYAGPAMRITTIAAPARYAEAAGCRIAARDRDHLVASCAHPSLLVRRELFYPGWQARVDGRTVPVVRSGEIFQSLPLPAGRSEVVFRYRPPHAPLAAAIAVASLLLYAALPITRGPGSRPRRGPGAAPLAFRQTPHPPGTAPPSSPRSSSRRATGRPGGAADGSGPRVRRPAGWSRRGTAGP